MATEDKLARLMARCKCGVHLTMNRHRDYYDTIETVLKEIDEQGDSGEIVPGAREEILRTGNLVDLQFYPLTPIGFYRVIHHDVAEAVNIALMILDEHHPD